MSCLGTQIIFVCIPLSSFFMIFQLFEFLKPSKVVILSSAPACEYHTDTPEDLKSDFVKVLKTDSWLEKLSQKECSLLETPNVISGVAASGEK